MIDGFFKRGKCANGLSNLSFEPCPELFNRVQVRTVGWQKKKLAPRLFDEVFCAFWFMKSCVIHNNNLPFFKFWYEDFLGPYFKELRITGALKCHGRDDFFATFCSNKTVSCIAFSSFFAPHFFAYFRAAMSSANITINARFINKNKAFGGYRLYFFKEFITLFFASFSVEERFFLSVILRRLRAKNMAGAVTWKCSAICFK